MKDNFFHKVYTIVCQIPKGKVSTYGAIGKYLGSAKSARMVGWALNKCPNDVPAHRVVNQKGLLTGKVHFEGITLMQQLLENEGLVIENNQIIDLEKHLWSF
ncbi:MAG TPA: MGMT family protein [Flavobacteriales bacterium]|jgi:methylated-DNA-protein-cysteine methyltransferase-like protein|nr:MGMT family protein [Flavobacteriales bacterium]